MSHWRAATALLSGAAARSVMGSETKNNIHAELVARSQGRLRELDGWRAISVMLVIAFHIGGLQHHRIVGEHPFVDLRINWIGPLGVKIFFVISGFVICRLLILEELQNGAISLKAFYYRRIFRIVPPLYFYLAVVSALSLGKVIWQTRYEIFCAATFLTDLVRPSPPTWFVYQTWSLAVEEQFYLVFPALLILTPKRWRSRSFFSLFIACVLWRLSTDLTGWGSAFVSGSIRASFACVAFGVWMALNEGWVRSVAQRMPALVVAAVGLAVPLYPAVANDWRGALYEALLVPPAIGLVLIYSLDSGKWLRRFLCAKPVQAVGVTSYGIYLWQQLFTAKKADFYAAGRLIPSLLPLLFLIIPFSYFCIEKPAMRLGRTLSQKAKWEAAKRVPTADAVG
jgi:peptidoglycan/LPS O-acetylase OafA/YrhL